MVELFMSLNSTLKGLEYNRNQFNMAQNRIFFDYTQFLNLHYCTNRDDSPFWRHMTANKTKWVKTMEDKCKHEFIDVFRNDDMLDYWGHDNYIQVMNGIHMFNKKAIRDYANSRMNTADLLEDARQQHEYIENSKKQFEMIDHKQFLETIKGLSTLPYI